MVKRKIIEDKLYYSAGGVRPTCQYLLIRSCGGRPAYWLRGEGAILLGSAFDGLAGVARVPIHFARYVHYDCQYDEKRDCAHEQRVILLPQSDVEECVNARQSCADH